jgi:hypothetical protein
LPPIFKDYKIAFVLELRRQIDAEAEHERFLAKRLAATAGAKLMFTPPYVGKFWNPVELLWSSAKRAYRRLPKESRSNETMAVEAMKRFEWFSVPRAMLG